MASLTGCSGGVELNRREVRGSVTMKGEPLETGTVTLFPLGNGHVASGRIENGTFLIEQAFGPIPGDYRVEITGQKSTGKMIRVEEPGAEPREVAETKSIVPGEYNERSTLALTVGEKETVVEQSFELK
ncbi:hypothetical protein [Caulifigura coniformis]|nr:hypothetical protein [Caulifigura coniformis]